MEDIFFWAPTLGSNSFNPAQYVQTYIPLYQAVG